MIVDERSFDSVAAFVAVGLSARVGVSTLLHPFNIRQTNSLISLYVVYEALVSGVTADHLAVSWEHALANAPQYSDMGSKDRDLVAEIYRYWVTQCLNQPSYNVYWDFSDILSGVRL